MISSMKINGKILLVVFRKTNNIHFVITAFMTSKSSDICNDLYRSDCRDGVTESSNSGVGTID